MEHEIQRQRTKIEESGKEAPELILVEDSTETVEELEGSDNLALHESAGEDCCCRPPAGAEGHFPEPGFEGEAGLSTHSAVSCAHHLIHVALTANGEA